MKDILRDGIGLFEDQIHSRDAIRVKSKSICGDLLQAHCIGCGIIRKMYNTHLGKPGLTNQSISSRLPLIASFIQGIDLCEIAIIEGLYPQAAVLLKQELETVAAINECSKGTRMAKKTPNVRNTEFNLQAEYGHLNGIGHVSDPELFEPLFKTQPLAFGQDPVSIVPIFCKEECLSFYAMHLVLITQVIEQLFCLFTEMYPDTITKDEKIENALIALYSILIQEKCLLPSE